MDNFFEYYQSNRHIEGAWRGDEYSCALGFKNKQEFLDWLDGSTVIDVGSGFGTLAKTVELERLAGKLKSNTRVYSLNPALADARFRKKARRGNVAYVNGLGEKVFSSRIGHGIRMAHFEGTRKDFGLQGRRLPRQLNKAHDDSMLPSTWDKISLPDGSVDKIAANNSFPMWCKSLEDLKRTVKEFARVLKVGGELRINEPNCHIMPELEVRHSVSDFPTKGEFYAFFSQLLEQAGFTLRAIPMADDELMAELMDPAENESMELIRPFCLSAIKTK